MVLKFTHILNKLELKIYSDKRVLKSSVTRSYRFQKKKKSSMTLFAQVEKKEKEKSIAIHIPTYNGLHQTIEKYYAHNQHWKDQRMCLC